MSNHDFNTSHQYASSHPPRGSSINTSPNSQSFSVKPYNIVRPYIGSPSDSTANTTPHMLLKSQGQPLFEQRPVSAPNFTHAPPPPANNSFNQQSPYRVAPPHLGYNPHVASPHNVNSSSVSSFTSLPPPMVNGVFTSRPPPALPVSPYPVPPPATPPPRLPQPPLPAEPPPQQPPLPTSPPPYVAHQPKIEGAYSPYTAAATEWVAWRQTVVLHNASPTVPPPWPPRFPAFRPRFNQPHRMRFPMPDATSPRAKKDFFLKRKAEEENKDEENLLTCKKRPMSKFYSTKPWNQKDAEKALAAEIEMTRRESRTLVIRFPEKDITKDMVSALHPSIEKVHFQSPGNARYCFVKVKDGDDTEALIEQLNNTQFLDMGLLRAEMKADRAANEYDNTQCDTIDPYTLYLGNLPLNINTAIVKEKFPTAMRIDIGFAQRMKYTRYAFIRYQTVEDAIDGFKAAVDLEIDSRTLIVRFRRQKPQTVPTNAEAKVSKKVRKERKKLLEQKEKMQKLQEIVSEKVKKEKLEPGELGEMHVSQYMHDDDVFDDGRILEHDDDDFETDDDDNDDDVEIPPPRKNCLNHAVEEEEDDDDDDDEDDDDDDDDDVGPPVPIPIPLVRIKKEKDRRKNAGHPVIKTEAPDPVEAPGPATAPDPLEDRETLIQKPVEEEEEQFETDEDDDD